MHEVSGTVRALIHGSEKSVCVRTENSRLCHPLIYKYDRALRVNARHQIA